LLEPGTYYLNPHMFEVTSVSIRSQMTDFHDNERTKDIESIEFPSNDGFSIVFDVSVEWRVDKSRVAEVFMLLGDVEKINANVITPNTRSISRVEGSKFGAKELIQGASREKFEVTFEQEMKEVCSAKGVEVLRALVRSIKPPDEVSKPIRETEVARQEELRNKQQMETAKSAAAKAEEEAKILQRQEQIKAETAKLVAQTKAQQDLAVAEIDLQTAKKQAENTVTRGKAEADVIFAKKKAEADGIKVMTDAFGGGKQYAMFKMAETMGQNTKLVWVPAGPGTFWGSDGNNPIMKWMLQDMMLEEGQKPQAQDKK
jgi:regulator of protease activity HflC (stomatin/prohibitin superfamily)